jgi:aquaporin Z
MVRKPGAEFLGTFLLALGGCRAAVLAGGFPNYGIGFLGIALAFGLAVVTVAYAVEHASGGHFNPAVTLGLWVSQLWLFMVVPVVGGLAGGFLYQALLGKRKEAAAEAPRST